MKKLSFFAGWCNSARWLWMAAVDCGEVVGGCEVAARRLKVEAVESLRVAIRVGCGEWLREGCMVVVVWLQGCCGCQQVPASRFQGMAARWLGVDCEVIAGLLQYGCRWQRGGSGGSGLVAGGCGVVAVS
jgi:hypothetical protein